MGTIYRTQALALRRQTTVAERKDRDRKNDGTTPEVETSQSDTPSVEGDTEVVAATESDETPVVATEFDETPVVATESDEAAAVATESDDVVADREGEVTPSDEEVEEAVASDAKSSRKVLISILIAILVVGGFALVRHQRSSGDLAKIQGKVALSAQELRDVVVAKNLTVYWTGPQDGAKYSLIASTPGLAFVRYLPGGVGLNDTNTRFRAVGTYAKRNAFAVSTEGALLAGNTGFVNADGNAVFYATARPSNVYIGIKGKDIQVEVFDPVADQALGLVLVKNQVRQIS